METKRNPRLVWRRAPRAPGLYGAMHNHERGWELRYGKQRVASVQASSRFGWMWSARADELGIPWCNTAAEGRPIATREDAQTQAGEYVCGCLARRALAALAGIPSKPPITP